MKKLIYGLLLFSTACTANYEKRAAEQYYFDLNGYVSSQVALLKSKKVSKTLVLNQQKDVQNNLVVDWAKELETLGMVDINRPVLKEQYDVKETPLGDYLLTQYTAKADKLTTRLLTVKQNQAKEVVEIYALYRDKNYLYHAEKEIIMSSSMDTLRQVEIKGFQKILFKDTLQFSSILSY